MKKNLIQNAAWLTSTQDLSASQQVLGIFQFNIFPV
jgi:hypothetical protein